MKYAKMLEGRYALILGGDTAIGAAVARLFAAHGAQVSPVGTPVHSSAAAGLCANVLKEFPYVDILVSATDMYNTGATHNFSPLDLQRMLDVNLGCAVRCFQELLPGMLEHRRGELVLFAPDLTDAGLPGAAAAAACAGAISSFARNVTFDYIRYRVRANTVLYPFESVYNGISGRIPLSGAPDASDAANAALWYACYLSRYVIGETLNVNGGLAYMGNYGSNCGG